MKYAETDLALARVPAGEDILLETLCFHAQQAAEKSIKAVLIYQGVEFPRTHSIAALIDLLPESVVRPRSLLDAIRLTPYGTVFRYPGTHEPVSRERYERLVQNAADVLEWAKAILEAG